MYYLVAIILYFPVPEITRLRLLEIPLTVPSQSKSEKNRNKPMYHYFSYMKIKFENILFIYL